MKCYAVAELSITDQSWIPSYVENVTKMVEGRGGKYLARTPNVEKLEGEAKAAQIFLIIEWPSKEAALDFYQSDEYKPYLQSRTEGATGQLLLVPGEDITGAAHIA
ncbi:MAG: DUF1330 domain-containing protein [Acidobacteria bacterium]|nr:DUF1330 domain-containing protein [Acidobacteriota bacterium]